jgi:Rha family phage regulatory protein
MFDSELVKIIDGKAVTTSRKVAEVFEKQHKHVLEAIRSLEIPEDFGQPIFRPSEYEVVNNLGKTIKYPEYLITRDGFTLLAMGFTGKKAMQFKIAYIEAFNAMEEQLKQPAIPQPTAAPDNTASTMAVIEKINQQILLGMEVDKEVLRYAWNIGKLIQRPMRRAMHIPSGIEDFIWAMPNGEFSRADIYRDYCNCCNCPVSARRFWPAVRSIRPFSEKRGSNGRWVVFE